MLDALVARDPRYNTNALCGANSRLLFIILANLIILKNTNRFGCNWLTMQSHRSSYEHDGHTKTAELTTIW